MEEQNNMDFEEQKPKKPFPTKIIAVVASVVIAVGVGATALALSLGGNTEPVAHECNFGDWITTKEATCTAMGEKTRTCECGEKELFPVAKLSHFFSEWTVIDNATCREAGKESRECACGEKETRIIDKLEHSYGDWIITKDATCKEEGSKYRVCSTCDLKTESNIEKSLNHTEVIDVAVAATCREFGKTEGKHCSVCDKILVYQKKIAKLDHTDGEWITDAEATCTTNGSKHQVCSVCNDTLRTETLNAFGHTAGEWITDAEATCTTNGSKHQVCAVCNDTLRTETLTALGHDYKEYLPESACVNQSITYECRVCEDTYSNEIQAISANIEYRYWSYVDSTCFVQDVLTFNGIQGGYGKYTVTITYTDPVRESHVYTYTNVDDLYTIKYLGGSSWNAYYRQIFPPFATIEVQDELGFKTTYTVYFPTLNPDKYDTGENSYAQDVIINVFAETVEHVAGEWITDTEATCTTNGSKHQVCAVCRDTIRTESVEASHSLNKTIVNATPTSFAKLVYDCDNCDYSREEEITPINVSASLTGSGTVVSNGGVWYTRSFEVSASGGYGQYKYKFESGSNLLQDYSTSNEVEAYGNMFVDLAVIKITVMDEAGQKTVYEIKGDGTYVDSYIIYD